MERANRRHGQGEIASSVASEHSGAILPCIAYLHRDFHHCARCPASCSSRSGSNVPRWAFILLRRLCERSRFEGIRLRTHVLPYGLATLFACSCRRLADCPPEPALEPTSSSGAPRACGLPRRAARQRRPTHAPRSAIARAGMVLTGANMKMPCDPSFNPCFFLSTHSVAPSTGSPDNRLHNVYRLLGYL